MGYRLFDRLPLISKQYGVGGSTAGQVPGLRGSDSLLVNSSSLKPKEHKGSLLPALE